jgi:hypothetical protein
MHCHGPVNDAAPGKSIEPADRGRGVAATQRCSRGSAVGQVPEDEGGFEPCARGEIGPVTSVQYETASGRRADGVPPSQATPRRVTTSVDSHSESGDVRQVCRQPGAREHLEALDDEAPPSAGLPAEGSPCGAAIRPPTRVSVDALRTPPRSGGPLGRRTCDRCPGATAHSLPCMEREIVQACLKGRPSSCALGSL